MPSFRQVLLSLRQRHWVLRERIEIGDHVGALLDLYSHLVVALAGKPEAALSPENDKDSLPAARGLPRTWDEVAPGHLVVAHESIEDGWWEAIIIDRKDDVFTLRYRDFPKLPKFVRHRSSIALIYPPDEERRPEASA
jgi:hypothetical protein